MRAVVAVIAKAPVAREVKTRLCPPLRPEDAARIAAAMLRDVVENCAGANREVISVYAGCAETLRGCLEPGTRMLPQGPGGLGRRLRRAQSLLFAEGYDRVLLMSGDSPTVEPGLIDQAFDALTDADVVLGPARDGGYTLLATSAPTPVLFERVEMSTPRVLDQTLAQARRHGLTTRLVATRHDIDTIADYRAALARGELRCAPRTKAAFEAAPASVAGTVGGGRGA